MIYTIKQQEDIVSNVIEQIEKDIAMDDYTSIYELLKFVPIDDLIAYLPEDVSVKFK